MGSVAVYDLSRNAGWAVWTPKLDRPRSGILRLPPPRTNGSVGPALKLLFEHIGWIDRNYGPIAHLGSETFISATGGRKDDQTSFVTSPKTQKLLIGMAGVAELAAEILKEGGRADCEPHSIHNMSWRRFWLGKQPRGTKREQWKALSVQKATRLGWDPKGDDEADGIGQLHYLLSKLRIIPQWQSEVDRVDGLLGL
jgi:hypothetical protein